MSTIPVQKSKLTDQIPKLNVNQNLVILTGAGISAESGLKTFRDGGGLWENRRIEDVATPQAFARNPELVHEFYNMRRKQLKDVSPNHAHCALSVLEKQWQGDFLLVTQNVDNLHERAGSENLIHMHGELTQVMCQNSEEVFEWEDDLTIDTVCPCCNEKGNLRPNIVWFGEMPMQMERIYEAIQNCDVFLSIGTSGIVYPAAGFACEAKQCGAVTIELNLDPTESEFFDVSMHGNATDLVRKLVQNAH